MACTKHDRYIKAERPEAKYTSLSQLKSIESAVAVKVIDQPLNVTIYDEVHYPSSDEDAYDTYEQEAQPEKNEEGIAMLIRMFRAHVAKIADKRKSNYRICWIDSMRDLIKDNGITTDEFEKMIA